MDYGFNDRGRFYVDHPSCSRPVGTLREEAEQRARDLYEQNKKIIVCMSSGLDSQVVLHSFLTQGIPVECAFLRLNGYNAVEEEQLKILEKKWGFEANVININPDEDKENLIALSKELDTNIYHTIHYNFIKKLPEDYNVIQIHHDPWIRSDIKNNKHYIYHSKHDAEIGRMRPLKTLSRSGKVVSFDDTSEYFLSTLTDDVFQNFLKSWTYFNGNNLNYNAEPLRQIYRYDFYIKPFLYAKHWGDALEYFPKFRGHENVDWITTEVSKIKSVTGCFIEINSLINHLKNIGSGRARYYELIDPANPIHKIK